MTRPLIVAIDGPAGAGKSSVSKILARRLAFTLVDTGAIYRCVALEARRQGIALDDDTKLEVLLRGLTVTFHIEDDQNHVFIEGKDVSEAIRTPENSLAASQVSSRPVVRNHLLDVQRRLALSAQHGAILEGRDIGTVVFPDAEVKVFLTAAATERAKRRVLDLAERGQVASESDILQQIEARDAQDSGREVAPLRPAADAVHLDSTHKSMDAVIAEIAALARAAGA